MTCVLVSLLEVLLLSPFSANVFPFPEVDVLPTISNDRTRYSSLISLFVMNESLLAFQPSAPPSLNPYTRIQLRPLQLHTASISAMCSVLCSSQMWHISENRIVQPSSFSFPQLYWPRMGDSLPTDHDVIRETGHNCLVLKKEI